MPVALAERLDLSSGTRPCSTVARMRKRSLGSLVAILCLLAIPAAAEAAPGDVVGQSCISETGAGGCAVLSQPTALSAATGIAVAPDGADVYVGANTGIAHFRRAPDGALTFANCVDTSIAAAPCSSPAPPDGGASLSVNAINLAISPDGRHVYAVSWSDALVWWVRDPGSGDLTWGGCRDAASDSATNNRCGAGTTFAGGNFPAGSMDFSQGIAVTPDGQTIYIADQSEGLLQAQRNPTTGVPTPTACFNTTGDAASGCTATAAAVPMALGGIDVGANSRDVYVRSISPGGITHFSRTAAGVTSFTSCVAAASPSASCATAAPSPVFAYSGSVGVAGDLLFTHGGNFGPPSGTVARFARNADGSLAFQGCATTDAAPGPCALLPSQSTGGSGGKLLVSPDASNVYLPSGGTTERALTRVTGSLAFVSCLSDTGVSACSPAPLPVPFAASRLMAFSPDGGQIYAAGEDTINVFEVERPASPGAGALPAPLAARPKATPPKIRSVKRLDSGRYRVKVRVFEAGTIRARFTGKLAPKAKKRTLGRVASKGVQKPGTYAIVVTPSRAARERRLKAVLVVVIAPAGSDPAQQTRLVKLK